MAWTHTRSVGEVVGVVIMTAGFAIAARWRPALLRRGLGEWRWNDMVARVVFGLWGIGIAAILHGALR